MGEYAWYLDNSDEKTHSVGQKLPNAWGIFDMHGNVDEWCHDYYSPFYYKESPDLDPLGPQKGGKNYYIEGCRIHRGGSWAYTPFYLGSSRRGHTFEYINYNYLGLRLVRLIKAYDG